MKFISDVDVKVSPMKSLLVCTVYSYQIYSLTNMIQVRHTVLFITANSFDFWYVKDFKGEFVMLYADAFILQYEKPKNRNLLDLSCGHTCSLELKLLHWESYNFVFYSLTFSLFELKLIMGNWKKEDEVSCQWAILPQSDL